MSQEETYQIKSDSKFKLGWKRFKKNKRALISFWLLVFLLFIALFSSFIANDQPIYVSYKGKTFYPAFSQHWLWKDLMNYEGKDSVQDPQTGKWEILQYDIIDWRKMKVDGIMMPLIPYSPKKSDLYNRNFSSPSEEQYYRNAKGEMILAEGKFHHKLGTDILGRDVLSGLIHGTKISLFVGIVAMGIAAFIGILLGLVAGFFGDDGLKINRLQTLLLVPALFFGYFYAFIVRGFILSDAFHDSLFSGLGHLFVSFFILVLIPTVFLFPIRRIKKGWLGEKIRLPLDTILSRSMEVFNAIPRLLLIISLSAIIEERSLWLVMVIIGLTSWTEIARFTRAEVLKLKNMEYITAAKSFGLTNWRIIFKHILPNAMAPLWVTIAFGVASAVLIESSLSFLNIGVPADTVTWGSMLNMGRTEPEAWWMLVFPGIAIFITVMIFNFIGDGLRDALDPKMNFKNRK